MVINVLRRYCRPLFPVIVFTLSIACRAPLVAAQTYPLAVTDEAIENSYVLHARNWPTKLGLPNPPILRTNAGERWDLIEISRDVFNPTFGNLFLPDTGWVAVAEGHHTQIVYTFSTVPEWAIHGSGSGDAMTAPYDIDAKDEPCMGPMAGQTSADGDCIWKEWITALMQKNCGVAAVPAEPLRGRCAIRYFEAWNEFNASNFWNDSLAHLAKMANDMALLVRAYCGDCQIIGGSTSAGGIGRRGDGPDGSGAFDTALGEFLDAWHAIPHASLPDIVSFHAYPSRTNVSYPPFPETNVSLNDSRCSQRLVPNIYCYRAIVDEPDAVRHVIASRPYLSPSTPIWNTESGWNGNRTLLHGVDAEGHADPATGILRQAFLARMTILMANKGVAVNLWYEADHQCDGTLYGFGLSSQSSYEMWQCRKDPVIPVGLTPAGRALNVLHDWLHGSEFTAACKSLGTVWWCPIHGPAIGDAVLAWTTRWDGSEWAKVLPGTFRYAHTLDGTTAQVQPGERPLLEPRPRLFSNNR